MDRIDKTTQRYLAVLISDDKICTANRIIIDTCGVDEKEASRIVEEIEHSYVEKIEEYKKALKVIRTDLKLRRK
jgi:hypothetical protein